MLTQNGKWTDFNFTDELNEVQKSNDTWPSHTAQLLHTPRFSGLKSCLTILNIYSDNSTKPYKQAIVGKNDDSHKGKRVQVQKESLSNISNPVPDSLTLMNSQGFSNLFLKTLSRIY